LVAVRVIPLQAKFAHKAVIKRRLAVVCLLLLSVSVLAQTHFHPDDSATLVKHCPICQVAHSSAQVAFTTQLHVVFATSAFLVISQDSDRQSNFYAGWHFSRPPPPQA